MLIAAVLLLPRVLSATVVVPADFKEIVADAGLIVRGHVTDVRAIVVADLGIETVATIAIDSTIKGAASDFVSVRVPGGVVGRDRFVMAGAPTITRGEQAVFFLKRDVAAGGWRPVGLTMGIFVIHASPAGRTPVIDAPLVAGKTASVGPVVRGDARRTPMAVTEFESLVRAVAYGQAAARASRGMR